MKRLRARLKSPEEIRKIRESGIITAEVFSMLSRMSLTDVSTWDIDSSIESLINRRKARPAFKTVPGYSKASCISINNEVVHGIPVKKKIVRDGDLVKIDVGVVLNGFFSDACYTFHAGNVSKNARQLAQVTQESLNRAVAVMEAGNRIGDIGNAIQEHVESYGYSVVRTYTGHGVGFALHEPPVVPHYGKKGTGIELRPGMVLAVEPIINEGKHSIEVLKDGWTAVTEDGMLSAQFEHTIAITDNGPLILTVNP